MKVIDETRYKSNCQSCQVESGYGASLQSCYCIATYSSYCCCCWFATAPASASAKASPSIWSCYMPPCLFIISCCMAKYCASASSWSYSSSSSPYCWFYCWSSSSNSCCYCYICWSWYSNCCCLCNWSFMSYMSSSFCISVEVIGNVFSYKSEMTRS